MNYRQNVRRGARVLDSINPDWYRKINPDILDIADYKRCVLGQLYENFWYACKDLELSYESAIYYGFNVRSEDTEDGHSYNDLTKYWKEEIARRMNPGGPPPPPGHP